MKKSITYLAIFIFSLSTMAQSNLAFFSEDGQRFHVIINGEVKNTSPQTRVKVENLPATNQKIKIKFEEDSLGEINRNLPLEPYKEYTFKVKKKKNSAVGSGLRKMGREFNRDVKARNTDNSDQKVDGDLNNKYALKFVSELDLTPPPNQTQQAQVANQASVGTSTTHTTTTTTTTTSTSSPQGDNVSMNVNISGVGANVQMQATDGGGYYEETTTVTTTTTGATTTDHYIMPGYSGAIGCPWPMQPADFSNAKASIASKDFSDTRLTVAKQVVSSNCLFSDQVREIMLLFDFEDTKLDFAKYAYGYTYDLNNYYLVNNAFEFESSIDELNQYISTR